MLTAIELRKILCETYHFTRSLGRVYDMFLCLEKGQTLKQVVDDLTIYLCVDRQVDKNVVIAEFHRLFKENAELNLLLGATGELFECPECSRKMTDFSFPVHLKNKHRIILVAVNELTCVSELEKKILRNTKKEATLPTEPRDLLEDRLNSSTIKSLYHSAIAGEKRKIRETTYKKFVNFEKELSYTKNHIRFTDTSMLNRAVSVQKTIRDAMKARRIVLVKKKRRKKTNRVQIFSGGLPGLGKK